MLIKPLPRASTGALFGRLRHNVGLPVTWRVIPCLLSLVASSLMKMAH
jgi:hypothetical protein